MKSITDLNGIGLDTNDYTDNRDPSVTFTTLYPVAQPLTVYQGAPHALPVASNITEIINYPQAAVAYIIDMRNTLLDCQVQWSSIPTGLTLTQPAHNVWKITGIKTVSDWNAIKSPTVTVNENLLVDFSYLVTVEYLSSKYVSWNVNIDTVLYDVLSTPSTFYFEDGLTQNVLNGPNIFDYRAQQSTWTVTITPDDLTVFTSMYTSGVGGTAYANPSTKVITISGTKDQVNSHLDNLYMVYSPTNTSDMNLTYFAINGTGTLSLTVVQPLVCDTVRYLGFATYPYYTEDVTFSLTGLPVITNYETVTSDGNTPKTVQIVDTLYDLTATGPSFSGDVVFSPSYTPAVGTGCFAFNPGNDGYLYAQNTNVGQMGSGDSTVELWFKPMATTMTGSLHGIINKRNFGSVGAGTWGLGFNASNNSIYFSEMNDVPGITTLTTAASTITRGAWHHIAVVRYSGIIKIYINGTLRATAANTSTVNYSLNAESVRIGDWDSQGGNQLQNAFVDEIRVSTTARYTTSFTPTTTAFTTDPYTTLLMHFEENARYDTSGAVMVNTATKLLGTGALWFNKAALTVNSSYDWNWFASDYTCELFVNKTVASPITYPQEIGLKEGGGSYNAWSFGIDNSGKARLYFYDGTERNVIGTTTLNLNTWHHIAFTFKKKTNTIKLFVNGIAEATYKVTGNPQYSSTLSLNLGKYNSNAFSGFMDEIRISKTVRYTNNFTPPTIAFTPDTYTNLLLHGDGFNGSVISDSSNSFTGANYTYVITPTNFTTASAWSNIASTGVGGTFTTSNGIITITGNRSQVNNRLSTITARPGSDHTGHYALSCTVTTPESATKSRDYIVLNAGSHSEASNVGGTRIVTQYDVANAIFATNTPQITDLDETTPSYTITLTSSKGKFGTTAANAVDNYSYTGTKAQINALFPTIIFINNANTYGDGTYSYSQSKNGVVQIVAGGGVLSMPKYNYSPTTSQTYLSSTMVEGASGQYTNPVSFSYLDPSSPITLVVQPTNILLGQYVSDFTWTVNWLDTAGMTVTKVGNVYTVTGIDTVAKWNKVKTFYYSMNSYFFGSFTVESKITSPFTLANGMNMTVTDEYTMSSLAVSSYTYSYSSSGEALNAKTIGLVPTFVDTGGSNTWTVTLTPSMLNVVSYSGLAASGATWSQTTSGILTLTGTIAELNTRLASLTINIIPYALYDFTMTWYASNGSNSEAAARAFDLVNVNTGLLSLTRANETFTTGVAVTISNGPQITTTESGNYTLDVYAEDMSHISQLFGYGFVTQLAANPTYYNTTPPTGNFYDSVWDQNGDFAAVSYEPVSGTFNIVIMAQNGSTHYQTLTPPPNKNYYIYVNSSSYVNKIMEWGRWGMSFLYDSNGNVSHFCVGCSLSGSGGDYIGEGVTVYAKNGATSFSSTFSLYAIDNSEVWKETVFRLNGTKLSTAQAKMTSTSGIIAVYDYNLPTSGYVNTGTGRSVAITATGTTQSGNGYTLSNNGLYLAGLEYNSSNVYIWNRPDLLSNFSKTTIALPSSCWLDYMAPRSNVMQFNEDNTRLTFVGLTNYLTGTAYYKIYSYTRSGSTWSLSAVNEVGSQGTNLSYVTISTDALTVGFRGKGVWKLSGGSWTQIVSNSSPTYYALPKKVNGIEVIKGYELNLGFSYGQERVLSASVPINAALPAPLRFTGPYSDINIQVDNITMQSNRTSRFELIYKCTSPSGVVVYRNQHVLA